MLIERKPETEEHRRKHKSRMWVGPFVVALLLTFLSAAVGSAPEIVVTSTADSGTGTLRWALQTAQSGDVITFDPAVFPPDDPATILVRSGLPALRCGNLTIDASNAGVTINGSIARGSSVNGLEVFSPNNKIRGLRIEDFSECGIWLSERARNNVIGGEATQGQGNTIVGCNGGVVIWGEQASHNTVLGNHIGTDGTTASELSNTDGIGLGGFARHNVIGPNNLIAYNRETGVLIADMDSFCNTVTENSIHSNGWAGIRFDGCGLDDVAVVVSSVDLTHGLIAGSGCADCVLEFFSDLGLQGANFEGQTTTAADGHFEVSFGTPLTGVSLTVTCTDVRGTTGPFQKLMSIPPEGHVLQQGSSVSTTPLVARRSEELEDNQLSQLAGLSTGIDTQGDVRPFVEQHLSLGLKWYRLAIDDVDWCHVMRFQTPYRHVIDPNEDEVVARLRDAGVEIMLFLVHWEDLDLCDQPQSPYELPDRRFSTDIEIEQYIDYIRSIVQHFRDEVEYYALLCEPNVPDAGQFVDAQDYIELTRRVVPVILKEDPSAKLIIGEVTPLWDLDGLEYLSVILDSDILPSIDGIAWHWGGASPEFHSDFYYGYPEIVREIRQTAEARGFQGELLAEELVFRTKWNPHPLGAEYSDYLEVPAAKYMARVAVMNLGLDLATGFGLENLGQLPSHASLIQNLCTVMASHEAIDIPVEIAIDFEPTAYCAFRYPNGDRMLAVWTDEIAQDEDPGIPAMIRIPGLTAESVTGIDVLHGFEQELAFEIEGGNTIIRDLLVKDYPILIRLSDVTMSPDYVETIGDGFHRLGEPGAGTASDRDGDGVPDDEDYCPDWPGNKEANGC